MLMDGISLLEGTKVVNLTVDSGTSFPASPNAAELFYRTDNTTLYYYNGSSWIAISIPSLVTSRSAEIRVTSSRRAISAAASVIAWAGATTAHARRSQA